MLMSTSPSARNTHRWSVCGQLQPASADGGPEKRAVECCCNTGGGEDSVHGGIENGTTDQTEHSSRPHNQRQPTSDCQLQVRLTVHGKRPVTGQAIEVRVTCSNTVVLQ